MTSDIHLVVIERDRAERYGELHHILDRQKPRGWKNLAEPLKSTWPDVPMNLIVLPTEEHRPFGHISGRETKRQLLQGLLEDHGEMDWCGKTYREWLGESPFVDFLGLPQPF